MKYLYSEPLVQQLHATLKEQSEKLVNQGIEPHLAVILVGNNEDSLKYISIKTKVAKTLGIIVSLYHVEETAPYQEVEELITFLNTDDEIHGIIIQLPLPTQFTSQQTTDLLRLIDPAKDVDGLGGRWEESSVRATHIADLQKPMSAFLPPMVLAVLSLLDYYDIAIHDATIAMVGKGRLVGGPLETYFKKLGIKATATDEETENILDITKEADIVISGTGESNLLTYQWIKPGAVVIDCAQDIHEDSISQVASALAPAKGGVGPLTVTWLLHNTIQAALNKERSI